MRQPPSRIPGIEAIYGRASNQRSWHFQMLVLIAVVGLDMECYPRSRSDARGISDMPIRLARQFTPYPCRARYVALLQGTSLLAAGTAVINTRRRRCQARQLSSLVTLPASDAVPPFQKQLAHMETAGRVIPICGRFAGMIPRGPFFCIALPAACRAGAAACCMGPPGLLLCHFGDVSTACQPAQYGSVGAMRGVPLWLCSGLHAFRDRYLSLRPEL